MPSDSTPSPSDYFQAIRYKFNQSNKYITAYITNSPFHACCLIQAMWTLPKNKRPDRWWQHVVTRRLVTWEVLSLDRFYYSVWKRDHVPGNHISFIIVIIHPTLFFLKGSIYNNWMTEFTLFLLETNNVKIKRFIFKTIDIFLCINK